MQTTKKTLIFIIIMGSLFIWQPNANARQNILNIPSTEVVAKGKIYPKVTLRIGPFKPDTFENLLPAIDYGIAKNIEIYTALPIGQEGVTVFNVANSKIDFNSGIKKRFDLTKTTKLAIGQELTVSLQNADTPSNFGYLIMSQEIPELRSRFTVGGYLKNPQKNFIPNKTGVLLGYEQPIIPERLTALIDWTSRNESFGYLATGFSYRTKKLTVIKLGVLIPNGKKAKFGFIFAVGRVL